MKQKTALQVRIESSIRDISAEVWDTCAYQAEPNSQTGESVSQFDPRNPFISHAFLSSLEESGAVSARTGWLPQHALVENESGEILAAMPCYLKSHSQGEYVFDHGWAEAYERAGGDYYPKLQVSVPFTPVTGPRLLVRDGPNAEPHAKHSSQAESNSPAAAALRLCTSPSPPNPNGNFSPASACSPAPTASFTG
jgi:uncharacterized protein